MAGFGNIKNLSRVIIPTRFQAEATSLPTPQFDDEATLLAQAVVPIEVAADSGNTRGYFVKTAIVLTAALLGAAVALSINFYQNRQPAAATAVVEPSATATDVAVSETLEASPPHLRRSNESTAPAQMTKAPPTADQSAPAATQAVNTKEKMPANDSDKHKENSADSSEAANRRDMLIKRSERQARRREAAQARSGVANQTIERPRDAARIREIFEGPGPF